MGAEPPDLYYRDELTSVYCGNAVDLLPSLAFDCVVSDPPYGISFAGYNHGTVAGDESDDLAAWLVGIDAPVVAFGANHYARHLPTVGAWSCWDKRTNENADRMFGSPFELIWASGDDRPGKMYRVQHGGVVNADGRGVKRVHPTQKPVTLMARVIGDWATDGVIVDPFMGSGSTLVAAKSMGRPSVGIEIDEAHCASAVARLSQGVLPFEGAA